MDDRGGKKKSILEKESSDYFYTQFIYWKNGKIKTYNEFEYN